MKMGVQLYTMLKVTFSVITKTSKVLIPKHSATPKSHGKGEIRFGN